MTSSTASAPSSDKRPVIVGVDGSRRSKQALSWAAHYASETSRALEVIVAWHHPVNYGWPVPAPEDWDPEADAKLFVDEAADEIRAGLPGIDLTTTVAEGPPAQVLTEASRSASLLVVGNRGRGEFAGMLLGSVSGYVTTHAHCPVVVFRDGTEDEQPDSAAAPAPPAATES